MTHIVTFSIISGLECYQQLYYNYYMNGFMFVGKDANGEEVTIEKQSKNLNSKTENRNFL